MTYITPDDLAMRQEMRDPWSKRGMVARGHLRQGNSLDATLPLMPSVPYSPVSLQRRVPRQSAPVPSRYPFDAGWRDPGMSGLGADPIAEEMEKLTAKMKTNLIVQTATVTAVAIAVQFLPIIGQVVGGVLLVVNSLVGASLRREGDRMLADFHDEMTRAGASFQAQLEQAHSDAFEQEKPAAIQLALSGEMLGGLGTLDGTLSKILGGSVFHTVTNPLRVIKLQTITPILKPIIIGSNLLKKLPVVGSVASDVRQAAGRVDDQINRPIHAVDQAVDTVTGVKGLQDVERAINNARPQALAMMAEQTNNEIAKINSPAYRSMLRNNIAKAIRASAPMQSFRAGVIVPAVEVAPTPLAAGPMAAAAGGVLLLLVGLGK